MDRYDHVLVYVVELRNPIPLGGIVNQIPGLILMILSLWFQMPKAWRKVASFKNRAKWVIVFHLAGVAISALYWVLLVIMVYVPLDYQPIMAVVIPLFREGLLEILKMIGKDMILNITLSPKIGLTFPSTSLSQCRKSRPLC